MENLPSKHIGVAPLSQADKLCVVTDKGTMPFVVAKKLGIVGITLTMHGSAGPEYGYLPRRFEPKQVNIDEYECTVEYNWVEMIDFKTRTVFCKEHLQLCTFTVQ
jgi:hypothetical protein